MERKALAQPYPLDYDDDGGNTVTVQLLPPPGMPHSTHWDEFCREFDLVLDWGLIDYYRGAAHNWQVLGWEKLQSWDQPRERIETQVLPVVPHAPVLELVMQYDTDGTPYLVIP